MNEFYNTIILKHGVGSYSKKQFNNLPKAIASVEKTQARKN